MFIRIIYWLAVIQIFYALVGFSQNQCMVGVSRETIHGENIRADFLTGGDFFWNPNLDNGFYWPLTGNGSSRIFCGGFWFGGMDLENNQLITSVQTYRQSGLRSFWPGPVVPGYEQSPQYCKFWDRHFKVTKASVDSFSNYLNPDIFPLTADQIPMEIRLWPGRGNPFLLQTVPGGTNIEASVWESLAPFKEFGTPDGIYQPEYGDIPDVGNAIEMTWWVLNDIGNSKNFSFNSPGTDHGGGIEFQFLVKTFPAFNNQHYLASSIFLNCSIRNKGIRILDSCYMGLFLGGQKPYKQMGCDVKRNVSFTQIMDNGGGEEPLIAWKILQGPDAYENDGIDNDRDGLIDEPSEEILMSGFSYIPNSIVFPFANPERGMDFYNFQRGRWNNAVPFSYDNVNGKTPISSTALPTKFLFPGNSDPIGFGIGGNVQNPMPMPPWYYSLDTTQMQDKTLTSTGPFHFPPGKEIQYTVCNIFGFGGDFNSNLELVQRTSDSLDAFFSNLNEKPGQNSSDLGINVIPNPTHDKITIKSLHPFKNLTILNQQGKRVKQFFPNSKSITVSMDDCISGLYLIRVEFHDKISSLKFIKL